MKTTLQLAASLICIALTSASVQAATKYWDLDGATTTGAGGATPAGTWDTGTTANWTTDATGASAGTTFADNDDAVFAAGSDATGTFAIDVTGTPIVGNLTNEEGTVTISGGTALNVGGAAAGKGIIDVFANSTLTINLVVTGGDNSGSITKGISGGTNTGALVLGGANTYTGQTAIYVGTVSIDNIGNVAGGASALGNPANATSGTLKLGGLGSIGATLKYTGAGHSTDRTINFSGVNGTNTIEASGSGPLAFTNTTLTAVTATGVGVHVFQLIGTNTGENKITGVIAENGSTTSKITQVRKLGTGTWVLTGVNTFSGVCDVREGTLIINSIGNKGVNSAVGSGNVNVPNSIIGLGSGPTTGTLKYIGTGHGSSRGITLWGSTGNGAIDASGVGPLVLSGTFANFNATGVSGKTLTLKGTSTAANTISAAIPDGHATTNRTSIIKEGEGTWVLSGPNTYTGNTAINGGTLLVNSPGSLATGSAVTVAANATLGGNGTVNGTVSVDAGGTLSPGASLGTLTSTLAPSLTGTSTNLMEINRTNSPNADKLVVSPGGGALVCNGTLNIINTGPALAAGNTFDLFDAADGMSGAFSVTNLPPIADPGLRWNTSQLMVNGTISVEALCTPATVNAGPDQTVCASSPTVTLAGSFAIATNATWSGGAGVFGPNNTTTNATYTPTAGEITAGTVTLTLTTDAGGTCGAANDVMTITINPAAIVGAGPDQTICADGSATLAGNFGGAATNATWTSSGDGLFGNNTVTNTTYTPGTADKTAGTVTLTLTTADPVGPCGAVNDSMVLTINAATAINTQPANLTVCAASPAVFTVGATGAGLSFQWQESGDGGATFTNTSITTVGYTNLAVMPADNGKHYQVIVTGTCGSMTSSPPAVLTVNVPTLSIVQQSGNVVLSWPVACNNYVLEEKGEVPAGTWTAVGVPVVPVGDQNTVTTPIGSTNQFFRLRYP